MAIKKKKENDPINQICRSCKGCEYLEKHPTHYFCTELDTRVSEANLGCNEWVEKEEKNELTKVSEREERFCQEYMIDLNASRSCVSIGYSEKGANVTGSKLLAKPNIQARLTVLRAEASEKLGTTKAQMLEELKNWFYSDITQTMNMSIEQIKALPPEIRRLITSYKATNRVIRKETLDGGDTMELIDQSFELKFVSKEKAAEMIGRHIGLFEKDQESQTTNIIVVRPQKPE